MGTSYKLQALHESCWLGPLALTAFAQVKTIMIQTTLKTAPHKSSPQKTSMSPKCLTNPVLPWKGTSASMKQKFVSICSFWLLNQLCCLHFMLNNKNTDIKCIATNQKPSRGKTQHSGPQEMCVFKNMLQTASALCGCFTKSPQLKYLCFNIYPQTGLLFPNCPGNAILKMEGNQEKLDLKMWH